MGKFVRTMRAEHVRRLKAREVGPGHEHIPEKIDESISRCRTCRLLFAHKVQDWPSIRRLPPILAGRRLPPTDKQGRYYADINVGKKVRVRRCLVADDTFFLLIRIPTKGWRLTQIFHALQWDKVLTAMEEVGEDDPVALYHATQMAVMGRCWDPEICPCSRPNPRLHEG